MGFSIAWGSPATIWCPVDDAAGSFDTAYIGQLVIATSDGVANMGQASGVGDTSGKKIPFGVVVGTNAKTPTYNSTYQAESITSALVHASTTEYVLHGGSGKAVVGDPTAMVQVALIDPSTYILGPWRNGNMATNITVGIVTTGNTAGTGFTASAGLCDYSTPVADICTVYCRTGANRGIYRITTDTSATVKTVDHDFPYDIAIGDTFVSVPARPWGTSYVQTDSEAMYLSASNNPATNYWTVEVVAMDLSVAGNESIIFRFNADHFGKNRA